MCQLVDKRAQSNTCTVLEFTVALGFLLAVVIIKIELLAICDKLLLIPGLYHTDQEG